MADAMCKTAVASTLDENVPSAIPRMILTYANKSSYGQQSIVSLHKKPSKKEQPTNPGTNTGPDTFAHPKMSALTRYPILYPEGHLASNQSTLPESSGSGYHSPFSG